MQSQELPEIYYKNVLWYNFNRKKENSLSGEVCPTGATFRYSKPEVFKKPGQRVTKMPVKSDMGGLLKKEHP